MQSNILLTNAESSLKWADFESSLQGRRIRSVVKRCFDLIFSILGLLVTCPALFAIALVIKLDSKGPAFFKQERVGRYGRIFKIYKFRTMVHKADKLGKQITIGEDNRITRVGRFIRKYKIDELPQLINVLKGEMSFVGPRPEVIKYVEKYTNYQRQVLMTKPGITDYASIEFRNESELLGQSSNPEEMYISEIMPRKIDLNMRYIRDMSIATDIKLIFQTLMKIASRQE